MSNVYLIHHSGLYNIPRQETLFHLDLINFACPDVCPSNASLHKSLNRFVFNTKNSNCHVIFLNLGNLGSNFYLKFWDWLYTSQNFTSKSESFCWFWINWFYSNNFVIFFLFDHDNSRYCCENLVVFYIGSFCGYKFICSSFLFVSNSFVIFLLYL